MQRACSAPAGPNYAQCLVLVRTGVATHKGVARDVTPVGYGPSSLQAAYNLTLAAAASGKGQTVAIVDAYDDPDAESDLAVYRAQYGLPPCTTANGCFDKVNQEGEVGPLPAAAGTTGWATEESLDLDMVSAICPNCHIMLVEADNNLFDDMGAGVDSAVALGSQFVSNSYAGPEASGDTAYTAYYDHPGVAVTVAAGDSGYGVEFPAASPYVTAVGGTELIADKAAARGWAEQVWGNGTSGTDGDGTGSGCSAYEAKPSWQADTGCGNRTVADVAADADPYTAPRSTTATTRPAGWRSGALPRRPRSSRPPTLSPARPALATTRPNTRTSTPANSTTSSRAATARAARCTSATASPATTGRPATGPLTAPVRSAPPTTPSRSPPRRARGCHRMRA